MKTSLLSSLFSVKHHPRFVIADRKLRNRYQRRRLLLAILGGAVGGVGVGFSFSSSGLIGAGLTTAMIVPVVLGTVVAALFVLVPLPKILRWLATVAAIVICIGLLEMTLQWKIALAIVGFAISWLVAVVLQFGIGVARLTTKDFITSLSGLLLAASAVALGIGLGADPAAAQTSDEPQPCRAGRLEARLDDDSDPFVAEAGSEPLEIELAHDGPNELTLLVTAAFDDEDEDAVVRLVGIDPLPSAVWDLDDRLRELREPRSISSGSTEIDIVRLSDSSGTNIRVSYLNQQIEAPLIPGLWHLRAGFADQALESGCHIDILLRVTATPLDTTVGKIGLVAAISGLGMAAGALSSGSVREKNRLAGLAAPAAAIIRQRMLSPGNNTGGDTSYELILQLQISEDDDRAYEVQQDGLGPFLSMVHVGVVGAISGAGAWEIPIEVRTDPKKVEANWASFQVNLVGKPTDAAITAYTVSLPSRSHQWRVDSFDGSSVEIDLRDRQPDDPPSPGTAPSRSSGPPPIAGPAPGSAPPPSAGQPPVAAPPPPSVSPWPAPNPDQRR